MDSFLKLQYFNFKRCERKTEEGNYYFRRGPKRDSNLLKKVLSLVSDNILIHYSAENSHWDCSRSKMLSLTVTLKTIFDWIWPFLSKCHWSNWFKWFCNVRYWCNQVWTVVIPPFVRPGLCSSELSRCEFQILKIFSPKKEFWLKLNLRLSLQK